MLKRIFKMASDPKTKGGRAMKLANRIKYIGISLAFAAVLAAVFDKNLRKLYGMGGDLPSTLESMFTILMSMIFAIIGVYLVVHVLHPNFGKRPMPASLKKAVEGEDVTDMTKDELLQFIRDLESNDEEIRAYMDTIGIKTDIAVTLGMALAAFFFGMYGYMTSYTIGYESAPNILPVSLCFMFIIFSSVYMILKTMRVVWDV